MSSASPSRCHRDWSRLRCCRRHRQRRWSGIRNRQRRRRARYKQWRWASKALPLANQGKLRRSGSLP
jgi:hypothetical protein